MITLLEALVILFKGYDDKRLPRNTSDEQYSPDDIEQESKASSHFISAKQKLVSSNVHHQAMLIKTKF